jgi:pimeloyl-ACP methyl ester carboxylesterase
MTFPEAQEGFISHNGARIHYTSTGKGTPLIFVHAGIADSRMWQPQIEFFSPRYQVITFDLRGFGQTAMSANDFSSADDLKAVMDGLGIKQAVLLGCSMGGSAVINFTLQYPQRTLALVPICASIDGFEVEDSEASLAIWTQAQEARQQGNFERYAEHVIRLWIIGQRRKPEEVDPALRAFVKEMLRTSFDTPADQGKPIQPIPPAAGRLGEIQAPTLVIAGQEDVPEMEPYVQKLASDIPGARLVVIERAGHLPGLERPAEFNRLVADFLTEVLKA